MRSPISIIKQRSPLIIHNTRSPISSTKTEIAPHTHKPDRLNLKINQRSHTNKTQSRSQKPYTGKYN
ncbi:MAG: hypothetical protein ACK5EU_19385 [Pseudanabaena sp.]|nr:hypothetical protein [Pseudanabaena sp. M051S1SP2A07QC]MCA6562619.1 hypothetical protein [Pseudanabaena sp. M079S1SP2A07QC]MCA6594855.1 hypothetical protein [Pseudanabaena sp. M046S1SP1A06QC]MCA6622647.1 hypothetical protein [Pseudanabaena sp. M165S2SP1A06QC]